MKLNQKIVLVTGAGRGIGRSIAQECAREGAVVVLLSRTESELRETRDSLRSTSPRSYVAVVDIVRSKDVAQIVGDVVSQFGRIDALVNNAGVQPPIGPFTESSLEDWWRNVEVNLLGTATMCWHVLPIMKRQKSGKIVNLSGGGSTAPRANFSAYAASKTAVVRFTETLAAELCDEHIDVNAVAPGAINTRMLQEVLKAGTSAGKEFEEASRRNDKGGDDPRLASELVVYLVSDDSDGVTGKLISAKWDPWRDEEFRKLLKTDRDIATLRRIDLKTSYHKS